MQQRTRRRQPQAVAQLFRQRLQPVERGIQIGLPDVAAIDHPHRQHLVRRQQIDQRQHIVTPPYGIHMHPGHRQVGQQIGVVLQLPEIGCHQQLHPVGLELVIGRIEGMLPGPVQFGHQNGLVDLHPFHPFGSQHVQQLGIHRQQTVQQRQPVGPIPCLADGQIGNGADDHRLGLHPLRLRFRQLFQQTRCIQPERRAGRKLGHDVVIIGVEPLGHLTGRHGRTAVGVRIGGNRRGKGRIRGVAGTASLLRSGLGQRGGRSSAPLVGIAKAALHRTPPGHPEIIIQHITAEALDPLGQIAQQEAHVQHLVIERKIAHRHQAQPVLHLPVTGTQFPAHGPQRLAAALALPVRLQGELQFTFGANARKTEIVGDNHDESCLSFVAR